MALKLSVLLLLLLWLPVQRIQAQTANLKIIVSDVRETSGNIKLGVFNKTHNFMTKTDPYLKSKQDVKDSVVHFYFRDVPLGRYAIATYHDENNDDTLNTKKLGIPVEGVGFSGNFNSRIKPPDFRLASFKLKQDTSIFIPLIYSKKQQSR